MNIMPKVIHYFWFGNNPKPEIVTKCIASWKKYMPDWEIKEWNESNYDVQCCRYVEQAYKAKKWAFVSDYARFDILNRIGGLYFDTDVELLKPIPDCYFENPFTAVDSNGMVAPGQVIALPKAHWLSENIVNSYRNSVFDANNLTAEVTINTRVNNYLKSNGFIEKDEFQKIADLCIYPSVQFCGFDVTINEYNITNETIAVHHFAGSWLGKGYTFKRKIQKLVKRLIGLENYKKLLKIKHNLFGVVIK